ncbi:hypothetical protein BKA63DRAFT_489082 [Paraphoma chrysanthemicola]|nr:hypothetical protein BKA63DRAFT_489082 [Paraphoma chrysanthemicola]
MAGYIDKSFAVNWIRMTRLLTDKSSVKELHEKNEWLWDLFTEGIDIEPPAVAEVKLRRVKEQFDLQPFDTIEKLYQFGTDLRVRETTNAFLNDLSSKTDALRECWYWIQEQLENSNSEYGNLQSTAHESGQGESKQYASGYSAGKPENDIIVKQVQDFATTFHRDFTNNPKIKWRTPPLVATLEDIFTKAAETWTSEAEDIARSFKDIASCNSLPNLKDSPGWRDFPLSILYDQNICIFSSLTTKGPILKTKLESMSRLQDFAQEKAKYWGVVYREMEILRKTIEEQQQAITCMEYRQILERLPPSRIPGEGGPKWIALWDEIVNEELDLMVTGNFGPRLLTPLFEYKVKHLSKNQRHMVQVEISRQASVAAAAAAATSAGQPAAALTGSAAAPTAAPATAANATVPFAAKNIVIGVNSDPTNIFNKAGIFYKDWPGYHTGSDLFSNLSETIHGYGRRYEFRATNWPMAEQVLLGWLKPKDTNIMKGANVDDVNWDAERKVKGIL